MVAAVVAAVVLAQFHEHVDRDHTLSKIFASVHFLRIPHLPVLGGARRRVARAPRHHLPGSLRRAAAARSPRDPLYGARVVDSGAFGRGGVQPHEGTLSLPRMQLRSLQPLSDDHGV